MSLIQLRLLFVVLSLLSMNVIAKDTLRVSKLPNKITKGFNASARLTVFLFFSTECPLCNAYATYLNKLYATYNGEGVDFTYIFSSSFTSQQVQEFVGKYTLKGNIITDRHRRYMKAFHATITPEVFVVDERRQIVYSGAIDNRAYEIGRFKCPS